MFCPECRTEYKEGVKTCADCGSNLVAVLTRDPEPEFIEYEEVLAIFSAGEIALVKSMLDDAEIVYYFKGEMFNAVDPLIQPARLMVRRDQVPQARELLKDVEFRYMVFTPDKPKQAGDA